MSLVAAATEAPGIPRILPGDWGKVWSGWLAGPLFLKAHASEGKEQAGFTSSFGGVRALPETRIRNCAARGDEKPSRVESGSPGWFRVRVNRSRPEGAWLLLRTSTERSILVV
jgi:hypothetical protein